MHTEASTVDNVSVEEALEAKEDSASSSTTTSSANTPTDDNSDSFNFPPTISSGPSSLPNSPSHNPHHGDCGHGNCGHGNCGHGDIVPSHDQEDEEIDPILIAPVWVADELVSNCNSCGQSFNLIRRRHHCRNCGHIYCNQCSSHYVPLKQFGYNRPVRVCDLCFRSYPIHEDHHSPSAIDSSDYAPHSMIVTPSSSSVNNATSDDRWSN